MIYKMTLRNSYDLVREAKDDAIRAGATSVVAYIKVTYKPEGDVLTIDKKLQNTTSKILPLAAILAIFVIWHIASVTGMDRPKGMEGKKYATWDLDIEKATLKQVVEKDGGDFSKVKLIPSTVTDEVSALKRKS